MRSCFVLSVFFFLILQPIVLYSKKFEYCHANTFKKRQNFVVFLKLAILFMFQLICKQIGKLQITPSMDKFGSKNK